MAPAGYTLDPTYGLASGTSGYEFNTSTDSFSVRVDEAPEPSTYALLGLGGAALIWMARRRSARI